MLSKSYTELMEDASKVNLALLTPENRKEFLNYLDDISVKAARENFYYFVRLMAPERIRGTFKDGLHIRLICHELQKLYENIVSNSDQGRKLQVFLPPESMKTELCTIMFPAWCIGRDPTWRALAVAHGGKHAGKHMGKPTKDLIRSDIYRRIFPRVALDKESKANEHWNTSEGGGYFALGAKSPLPGKRANLSICLRNDNVVLTSEGVKEVGELVIGDRLLGRFGYEEVTALVDNHHKLCYTVDNQVDCSPEHPFLTKAGEWVEVKDLRIGDKIRTMTVWQRLKESLLPEFLQTAPGRT